MSFLKQEPYWNEPTCQKYLNWNAAKQALQSETTAAFEAKIEIRTNTRLQYDSLDVRQLGWAWQAVGPTVRLANMSKWREGWLVRWLCVGQIRCKAVLKYRQTVVQHTHTHTHTQTDMHTHYNIYIYIYIYIYINHFKSNDYSPGKWNQRAEFKSWSRIMFLFALMP